MRLGGAAGKDVAVGAAVCQEAPVVLSQPLFEPGSGGQLDHFDSLLRLRVTERERRHGRTDPEEQLGLNRRGG
jgi:hypothetical protein